jgi:hypothetical protein
MTPEQFKAWRKEMQGNRVNEELDSGVAVPGRLAGASRHKAVAREVMPAFSRRAERARKRGAPSAKQAAR